MTHITWLDLETRHYEEVDEDEDIGDVDDSDVDDDDDEDVDDDDNDDDNDDEKYGKKRQRTSEIWS